MAEETTGKYRCPNGCGKSVNIISKNSKTGNIFYCYACKTHFNTTEMQKVNTIKTK